MKDKSNEVVGAWATITLGGTTVIRVVTWPDLEEARQKGLARSANGPWKTFPTAMYEKTAVKRLISRNEYLIRAAIKGTSPGLQTRMTAIVQHDDDRDTDNVLDVTSLDDFAAPPSEEEVKTVAPAEVQDPEPAAPAKTAGAPRKQTRRTPPATKAPEEAPPAAAAPTPATTEGMPPPPEDPEAPGSFATMFEDDGGRW